MRRSRTLLRLQLAVICLPFILAALVIAFGSTLPATHAFGRAVEIPASPESVFAVLNDIETLPAWSKRILRVEPLPARDGHPTWRQTFAAKRAASLEVFESAAPRRVAWRLADLGGPYRGTWEFTIDATADGSRVTLVERAAIGNAVSRFLAHFSAGSSAFAEDHLRDLAAHLGAPGAQVVTIEIEEVG